MSQPSRTHDVTALLAAHRNGDKEAEARLAECVYHELRAMARRRLRRERVDHTLQPTALVNEAWVRLIGSKNLCIEDRVHFFALASQVMRRILVDYARQTRAQKRDGALKEPLSDKIEDPSGARHELLVIDEALNTLHELDPRQARIVQLRFFGGLTEEEIAELLGVSSKTVKRDWKMARAWLRQFLGGVNGIDAPVVA